MAEIRSELPKSRNMNERRQSSRLDWAASSWIRWIQIPLLSWITPILSLGNKHTLVQEDLNDLSVDDKCSVLLNRVKEHSPHWQGTWHLFKQTFAKDFLISILLVVPLVMLHILQPWLIRRLIIYIKDQSELPAYSGYLFAISLCIAAIMQSIINQCIFFRNTRVGMRVRNTLSATIYKHLLTINTAALHETTAAQTINLVANDAGKFESLSDFAHAFVLVPLEAAGTFAFVWWNIGLPTLFGYAVLLLLIPMQIIFSRKFGQFRRKTMACTDKRVQTINELLNGCEIIKMYNWEKAMEQRVRETRQRELSNIRNASYLRALNTALSFTALPLISLATFGGGWLMGRPLLPEDVFSTLALFALVRVPMTLTMPQAIEKYSEACVSAKRIDRFMQLDRLSNRREKMNQANSEYAIIMEDASFSWKETPSLFSLNLNIKTGHLVGVKGSIGAGKSTFLAAILGEINLINGKLRLYVNSISYAPQSAWIFSDTIRANILLGKSMDEERYRNVIKACCLDIDLQHFGAMRDLLMIGDRGVNLSGGQKARISLARALYADADLYLLDDPLAAVDQKMVKNIFDQCIGPRSFLRGKTRILVTHQTHLLIETDQVILLTNGRIEEIPIEPHENITKSSDDIPETDSVDSKEIGWIPDTAIDDENSIVKNETSDDGAIKWNVWLKLFTSPPLGWYGFISMIIIMLVNEAFLDFTNGWLALWSSKNESEQRSSFYIRVYLGSIFSTFFIAIIRVAFFFYIMLCGSTDFHNRMLKGVLYTSLRFYESNPSGRVLNRASKDQQVLDESLPSALIDTTQCLLLTLGSVVMIARANPWVLLILIPLIPAVLWLRRFYIRSSRQLKRLESVTRSPVYTLFSSSLAGLTSIRAFDVQNDFLDMFIERVDTNSRSYFLLFSAARWFGLRLDFLISVFILVTATLVVALRHQIDPSTAALSISYCITLTGLFQWAVRQSTEAENFMTSAERIHEYGQLLPESSLNSKKNDEIIPEDDWPSRGIIEFKDYSCRYRPELNPVLKNLNLRIESKEKIGVIGRTGAGKSSLLQALFRLVDQSTIRGTILIDDIDIGRLSLDHLRSHLSVIPQMPILFCGTLRYNIDPFKQFSNEECLQALEAVQLKQLVRNHPDGLHLLVAESGTNLSAGERQLICVARAILKKSRILLIDEATANVDQATDQMIQEVIADKFRDRTILTIAHRLNTVANSDRILMLQHGEVSFFDVPSNMNLS